MVYRAQMSRQSMGAFQDKVQGESVAIPKNKESFIQSEKSMQEHIKSTELYKVLQMQVAREVDPPPGSEAVSGLENTHTFPVSNMAEVRQKEGTPVTVAGQKHNHTFPVSNMAEVRNKEGSPIPVTPQTINHTFPVTKLTEVRHKEGTPVDRGVQPQESKAVDNSSVHIVTSQPSTETSLISTTSSPAISPVTFRERSSEIKTVAPKKRYLEAAGYRSRGSSFSVPVSAVPVSTVPVSTVPVSTVPVSAIPVSAIPVSTVPVSAIPVSAIPVSVFPLSAVPVSAVSASTVTASTVPVSTDVKHINPNSVSSPVPSVSSSPRETLAERPLSRPQPCRIPEMSVDNTMTVDNKTMPYVRAGHAAVQTKMTSSNPPETQLTKVQFSHAVHGQQTGKDVHYVQPQQLAPQKQLSLENTSYHREAQQVSAGAPSGVKSENLQKVYPQHTAQNSLGLVEHLLSRPTVATDKTEWASTYQSGIYTNAQTDTPKRSPNISEPNRKFVNIRSCIENIMESPLIRSTLQPEANSYIETKPTEMTPSSHRDVDEDSNIALQPQDIQQQMRRVLSSDIEQNSSPAGQPQLHPERVPHLVTQQMFVHLPQPVGNGRPQLWDKNMSPQLVSHEPQMITVPAASLVRQELVPNLRLPLPYVGSRIPSDVPPPVMDVVRGANPHRQTAPTQHQTPRFHQQFYHHEPQMHVQSVKSDHNCQPVPMLQGQISQGHFVPAGYPMYAGDGQRRIQIPVESQGGPLHSYPTQMTHSTQIRPQTQTHIPNVIKQSIASTLPPLPQENIFTRAHHRIAIVRPGVAEQQVLPSKSIPPQQQQSYPTASMVPNRQSESVTHQLPLSVQKQQETLRASGHLMEKSKVVPDRMIEQIHPPIPVGIAPPEQRHEQFDTAATKKVLHYNNQRPQNRNNYVDAPLDLSLKLDAEQDYQANLDKKAIQFVESRDHTHKNMQNHTTHPIRHMDISQTGIVNVDRMRMQSAPKSQSNPNNYQCATVVSPFTVNPGPPCNITTCRPSSLERSTPSTQGDNFINLMPDLIPIKREDVRSPSPTLSKSSSILGDHPINDILFLKCGLCSSTYGSLHSFKKHFSKAHGGEPSKNDVTIQSISATRRQLELENNNEKQVALRELNLLPSNRYYESQISRYKTHGESRCAGIVLNGKEELYQSQVAEPSFTNQSTGAHFEHAPECTPLVNKMTKNKEDGDHKSLQCMECGEDFPTRDWGVFRRHVKAHEQPGDQQLRCSVCRQCFNDIRQYRLHVASCCGTKSLQCMSCAGVFFDQEEDLNKHMREVHRLSHGINCKCSDCANPAVFEMSSSAIATQVLSIQSNTPIKIENQSAPVYSRPPINNDRMEHSKVPKVGNDFMSVVDLIQKDRRLDCTDNVRHYPLYEHRGQSNVQIDRPPNVVGMTNVPFSSAYQLADQHHTTHNSQTYQSSMDLSRHNGTPEMQSSGNVCHKKINTHLNGNLAVRNNGVSDNIVTRESKQSGIDSTWTEESFSMPKASQQGTLKNQAHAQLQTSTRQDSPRASFFNSDRYTSGNLPNLQTKQPNENGVRKNPPRNARIMLDEIVENVLTGDKTASSTENNSEGKLEMVLTGRLPMEYNIKDKPVQTNADGVPVENKQKEETVHNNDKQHTTIPHTNENVEQKTDNSKEKEGSCRPGNVRDIIESLVTAELMHSNDCESSGKSESTHAMSRAFTHLYSLYKDGGLDFKISCAGAVEQSGKDKKSIPSPKAQVQLNKHLSASSQRSDVSTLNSESDMKTGNMKKCTPSVLTANNNNNMFSRMDIISNDTDSGVSSPSAEFASTINQAEPTVRHDVKSVVQGSPLVEHAVRHDVKTVVQGSPLGDMCVRTPCSVQTSSTDVSLRCAVDTIVSRAIPEPSTHLANLERLASRPTIFSKNGNGNFNGNVSHPFTKHYTNPTGGNSDGLANISGPLKRANQSTGDTPLSMASGEKNPRLRD